MRIGLSWQIAQALGATFLVAGFLLAHAWGEPGRCREKVPRTWFNRIRLKR